MDEEVGKASGIILRDDVAQDPLSISGGPWPRARAEGAIILAMDRQGTTKKGRGRDGYSRVYAVVESIPEGKVATYGQVAALAGLPGHARQVGYALHAIPSELDLPWHRVINAKGEISPRSDPGPEPLQRLMLEAEGVVFRRGGRVSLADFRWDP